VVDLLEYSVNGHTTGGSIVSWLQEKLNGKVASMRTPLARSDELVIEDVDDELLIYDESGNQAHCLGPVAGRVWRACDGRTTVPELSKRLSLDPETVVRAIEELDECQLLGPAPAAGVTRREATVKFAKVGAAAASVPLIFSIAAPTPALAVTEQFCLKLCPGGCGACATAGCCCCSPGGGTLKVCAIDCAHCNSEVLNQLHCGETLTSVPCSSGC
jgi:hypothetical protein